MQTSVRTHLEELNANCYSLKCAPAVREQDESNYIHTEIGNRPFLQAIQNTAIVKKCSLK